MISISPFTSLSLFYISSSLFPPLVFFCFSIFLTLFLITLFPFFLSTLLTLFFSSSSQHGRHIIDIASPKCKKAILQMIYIFRRYEITSQKQPLHQSSTCVVHLAYDHEDDSKVVALKFMKHRDHFVRELRVRAKGLFHSDFVVSIVNQSSS